MSALMLCAMISCTAPGRDGKTDTTDEKTDATTGKPQDEEPKAVFSFNFDGEDEGFTAIFADYPKGSEEFFELESGLRDIPVEGVSGKGYYLKGNNHSDDLFMGFYTKLTGFSAGEGVRLTVSFKLATSVEGGMIGIGGSPGESVIVKCGVTSVEPQAVEDNEGYYRTNIDAGSQANAGKDMKIVGNLSKQDSKAPGEFEFNSYTVEINAIANENGELWLIIATDSGFEGISEYYLDDVTVTVG